MINNKKLLKVKILKFNLNNLFFEMNLLIFIIFYSILILINEYFFSDKKNN
jgi:hypothetical protein